MPKIDITFLQAWRGNKQGDTATVNSEGNVRNLLEDGIVKIDGGSIPMPSQLADVGQKTRAAKKARRKKKATEKTQSAETKRAADDQAYLDNMDPVKVDPAAPDGTIRIQPPSE